MSITRFISDCSYRHDKFKDAYISVIESIEHDDHFMIKAIWKCQRTNRIYFNEAQKFSVPKSNLREWSAWQPLK